MAEGTRRNSGLGVAITLGLLAFLGGICYLAYRKPASRQIGRSKMPLLTSPVEMLPSPAKVASTELGTTAVSFYENIEEIKLLDIDPDLLMPRTIVVKRKFTVNQ